MVKTCPHFSASKLPRRQLRKTMAQEEETFEIAD